MVLIRSPVAREVSIETCRLASSRTSSATTRANSQPAARPFSKGAKCIYGSSRRTDRARPPHQDVKLKGPISLRPDRLTHSPRAGVFLPSVHGSCSFGRERQAFGTSAQRNAPTAQQALRSLRERSAQTHGVNRPSRRSYATHASRVLSPTPERPANAKRPGQGIFRKLVRWQKNHENDRLMARESQRDAIAAHAALSTIKVGGLKLPNQSLAAENEDTSFDHANAPEGDGTLEVGDLIAIGRTTGEPTLAAAVRRVNEDITLLYDLNGICFLLDSEEDAFYRFPHYFTPADLQRIQDHLPPTLYDHPDIVLDPATVPVDAGSNIMEKLSDLDKGMREVYRTQSENILETYERIARDNENAILSLPELAAAAFSAPYSQSSVTEQCALLCYYLFDDGPFRSMPIARPITKDPNNCSTRWLIQSRTQKKECEQVLQWVRQHREHMVHAALEGASDPSGLGKLERQTVIGDFTAWARPIIERSRTLRDINSTGSSLRAFRSPQSEEDADAGPSGNHTEKTEDSVSFSPKNDEHALIIRWLKNWSMRLYSDRDSAAASAAALILQETGMHNDRTHGYTTAWIYLKEIGAVLPWTQLRRYGFQAQLDSLRNLPESAAPDENSFGELRTDMLADMRKSWSPLTAFAIDTAGSTLLDDAFSIESIPDDPGSYRIHIHVANPTAYLQLHDKIAQQALSVVNKDYETERPTINFEAGIAHNMFSLKHGGPCLTFSGRLDSEGVLSDAKITPGFVPDLIKLDHDDVRTILYPNVPESGRRFTLSIGQNAKLIKETPKTGSRAKARLNEKQKDNLVMLVKASAAARPRLVDQGILVPAWSSLNVRWDDPTPAPSETNLCHTKLAPTILVRGKTSPRILSEEQVEADIALAVTKIMTALASEIAVKFCTDRNIPAMYAVSADNMAPKQSATLNRDAWKQIPPTRPALQNLVWSNCRPNNLVTVSMPDAGQQPSLSVTSPIRMVSHLIAHFQIQQSLILENGTEPPIVFSEDDPRLLFSHRRIEELIPMYAAIRTLTDSNIKFHREIMYKELLCRISEGAESLPEPKQFEVIIRKPAKHGADPLGWVSELDRHAYIIDNDISSAAGGMKVGDWWTTKLAPVDFNMRALQLEPVAKLGIEGRDRYIPAEQLSDQEASGKEMAL